MKKKMRRKKKCNILKKKPKKKRMTMNMIIQMLTNQIHQFHPKTKFQVLMSMKNPMKMKRTIERKLKLKRKEIRKDQKRINQVVMLNTIDGVMHREQLTRKEKKNKKKPRIRYKMKKTNNMRDGTVLQMMELKVIVEKRVYLNRC